MASPKRGVILSEYQKKQTKYESHLIDSMINAGKSIWAAFELNTARSPKYKISSTSLFIYCCTSSSAFCSTWRPTNTILRIAVCRTMWEDKWKIYDKKSNIYFSTDGHFCWFGYLNQLGKYGSVHSIAFQTHWKENSWSSPPPFRGMDTVFSGTTHFTY